VAAARRQSGEGKIVGGGENSTGSDGSVLKGSDGRGPEGWVPRGGGAGERGGLWRAVEQRGAVASVR
jgi:hypothetical protein